MSRDLLTLEEIKSYDDSYWLRYLAENTIFDTENIKAQKDWLINQLTAAKEEIARINCDYYADKQRFVVQRRELAEAKKRADKAEEREQKLKELLLEIKRDCRPSGWYDGPIYGQIDDLLASLYPKEEEAK
ncbi:hypothetical protein [Paenibacillus lautus]|uniref:Uncharacterized protein n=1 Tax=Paenibacillus lautus TaxID=1401 RepID=A0A385TTV0_PAELA|nr:hypothetical protein [Paenibacillus lautus]AYB47146.1 hypothetical protein D5F53_29305 [Paenibacillus lautus]